MTIILVLAFWTSLAIFPRIQEASSRIEQYLISQTHENGFSGEVLIAAGDELLIKKSFQPSSNLGSEVSQPEGRFPVGSIGEQFIAAAILQFELAGKVRLDSPVCDYISGCPNEWKQIQVLHLLTHSSGLPSLEGASCVELAASKSAVMAMLSAKPLLFEPGNRFNLNSSDYFFLSLVIQRISGQSTSEYLDQHIFRPLKLDQTGYLVSASQEKVAGTQTQTGCSQQGELPANLVLSSFSGELYTSVKDLYQWNHALSTDKFFPKNFLDQMYTPYIEGHGFGSKILKEFDRKVVVQDNESGSNSVSIRIYPDDDTCIIVVSQAHQAAASRLSHEVSALLFGKHSRISSNPTE
jgi:CubicO group peptidase (beta-lactamase class C family)